LRTTTRVLGGERWRLAMGLTLATTMASPQGAVTPATTSVGYDLPAAGILLEGIGHDPQRQTSM